jgi:hypothetical protein
MQSFCIGTRGAGRLGLGTGEVVETQREEFSFLDGTNGIGLTRMTRGKDIESKGKGWNILIVPRKEKIRRIRSWNEKKDRHGE